MKLTQPQFLTLTLTCALITTGSLHTSLTSRAESISSEEAHAIAVDAYVGTQNDRVQEVTSAN